MVGPEVPEQGQAYAGVQVLLGEDPANQLRELMNALWTVAPL
ncbi:hypothetical protein [Arthrobacter globiformis]|nr:hypothetical protein [Arthrobacter globiformis]MDQ0620621.1 hypothetical protein [Arthrobacter globiformis]